MLTALQAAAARVMAVNRSDRTYFAGGAVLNEDTVSMSDDLDIFTDTDEMIPDVVEKDVAALRAAGFEVSIDLEIYASKSPHFFVGVPCAWRR